MHPRLEFFSLGRMRLMLEKDWLMVPKTSRDLVQQRVSEYFHAVSNKVLVLDQRSLLLSD